MIDFVPYHPSHLAQVGLQPSQEAARRFLIRDGFAEALALHGMSWTGLVNEIPIGCAGMVSQWEGRVIAWALFGASVPKRCWPAIVRKIAFEFSVTLANRGRHRIEITVPVHFGQGCRLARLLGFAIEGRMRSFDPEGEDHFLYAKIIGEQPLRGGV